MAAGGDIVVLEAGDVVTADLRLVEAASVQSDESTLTGESTPVVKTTEPVAAGAPLAERASMVFKGTAITMGSGAGLVVATGMHSELGRITELVEAVESEATPLERRLDRLATQLLWLTLVVVAVVVVVGLLGGKPWALMIPTGIALAVTAVPGGLPVVSTLALARGMWRMARRMSWNPQPWQKLQAAAVRIADTDDKVIANARKALGLKSKKK